ncbi:MAG: hypothetical protein HYX92_12800 [Chloroflexi bacterium]|nr:hypothetical protein [Chloroflexota bacterium]
MSEPIYEVVWPLGKAVYETIPLAKRTPDLSGKTVCELWEWLFRGDEMFDILRESLSKRYKGVKFVGYEVFGNTHGSHEARIVAALPELLRQKGCDAVISAVGA